MKRKLFLSILIVFFTVSFMSSPSICFSEPDSKVWESFQPRFYYNKTNITKSSDIISVWIYVIINDDVLRDIRNGKIKKNNLNMSRKYQYYDHIVCLYKIDCKNKLIKIEEFTDYDDQGNILDQQKNNNSNWTSIIPNGEMEDLYSKLCLTPNKLLEKIMEII